MKSGLSAGRVQSVAVKLLVEREREVQGFMSTSEYKVKGQFLTKEKALLEAEMHTKYPKKKDVEKVLTQLQSSVFTISDLEQQP